MLRKRERLLTHIKALVMSYNSFVTRVSSVPHKYIWMPGRRKRDIPACRIDLFLHVEHCASKRGMPCEMSRLAYLVAVQAMPRLAAKVYFRNRLKKVYFRKDRKSE